MNLVMPLDLGTVPSPLPSLQEQHHQSRHLLQVSVRKRPLKQGRWEPKGLLHLTNDVYEDYGMVLSSRRYKRFPHTQTVKLVSHVFI